MEKGDRLWLRKKVYQEKRIPKNNWTIMQTSTTQTTKPTKPSSTTKKVQKNKKYDFGILEGESYGWCDD